MLQGKLNELYLVETTNQAHFSFDQVFKWWLFFFFIQQNWPKALNTWLLVCVPTVIALQKLQLCSVVVAGRGGGHSQRSRNQNAPTM